MYKIFGKCVITHPVYGGERGGEGANIFVRLTMP